MLTAMPARNNAKRGLHFIQVDVDIKLGVGVEVDLKSKWTLYTRMRWELTWPVPASSQQLT